MNTIAFHIQPSPESNDHEVRIIIDGEDFLGDGYLGIDPPFFFAQSNISNNWQLMIGRCTCGSEGCDDYPIQVIVQENTISWTKPNGLSLLFEKVTYLNTFAIASNDYSWEDINRKAERLASNVLRNTSVEGNYSFDWASARIKDKVITLSYSKNGAQMLLEIPWNGSVEKDAVVKAEEFKFVNCS